MRKNKQNEGEMKSDKQQKKEGEKNEGKMKSQEQQKKEGGNLTVVLKVDFHCDGCTLKIIKAVRSFEGVEKVTCDGEANKVTVIGKVDPLKLKEKVERKTNKAVQLVSPLPKDCKKEKVPGKNGEDKKQKPKEKEPPVTTAVLKIHLHCEGCIQKIQKVITKNKGYKEMKMDMEKDLVTVTGSMDMKELVEELKRQLKKDVVIVPPKKEGGEKKDGSSGGNGKGKDGQGGDNNKGGQMDNNGMQVHYGYPYMDMYSAIQASEIFSDENANACSIM
ncbi:PREDICTED: heavy metal-associated isoprenylated plant protein 3-like [Nicotiana attenuata]|uniref:Heavy metal-associated isoprenylated plant protein 3 n=1 Tax=Nicotiana attenuata TaxID=49451 RepID=A0A1J6KHF8_NICAT|nr:PREDICTED: heavy metal-associated isoprenylated plant protein 3-like [Nicotiana attenuata]OIT22243.1 heavy metal-associated isoprenylated plant protein 3 [Nicotiana attenuata]